MSTNTYTLRCIHEVNMLSFIEMKSDLYEQLITRNTNIGWSYLIVSDNKNKINVKEQ